MTGKNKRSVERDFNYYDPPEKVRAYIEAPGKYTRSKDRLEIRDRALMSLEYIAAARVVEITGGPTRITYHEKNDKGEIINTQIFDHELPGVQLAMFYETENFLYLRGLKNVKHKFIKRGETWQPIKNWRDYPSRVEIPIPRHGGLAWISQHIEAHLDNVDKSGDVFNIGPIRAYQIINKKTGLFNHYFKDMGLKLWFRLFGRDAFQLKKFSGHSRWENLERYMQDISQAQNNMLLWKNPGRESSD